MEIPDHNNEVPVGRFKRGRTPGKKLAAYGKKKNPNDRPSLQRFSVSLPVALARVVRKLKGEMDLEYSKIFRKGLDLVVAEAYKKREITQKTYDNYKSARLPFHDDDMTGT